MTTTPRDPMTPEEPIYSAGLDAALRCVAAQLAHGWQARALARTLHAPTLSGLESAAVEILHCYATRPSVLAHAAQTVLDAPLSLPARERARLWGLVAGEYALSEPGHDALAGR